jgi:2-octaprenyl-6-methoxyphenol hydroxylase
MYDVIIVGNGLTGGTLACALAHKGLQVALVDQQDITKPFHPDGKSFALSRSSYRLFSELAIWQDLNEVTPISSIHTSDGMLPSWVRYEENESEEGPLGYVVESALLKSAIYQKILSLKNITFHGSTSVKRCERGSSSSVLVETDNQITLQAPLCVASDGRCSMLRESAQIPVMKWGYDQIAIVCTVAHTLPHYNQAFEHFLPTGPLAFIPREGDTSGIVWSIESEKAKDLLTLSPEAFAEELQAHFGEALGALKVVSERWHYPLSVNLPKRIIDTRLALVGDAAHSFHPVAGQGLNVGLRDVSALARLLSEGVALGLDLGSQTLLEAYQRNRRADILAMTFFTDGVVRAFSTQSRLMARARSIGFWAVKNISPLKKFMIRQATGD